MDKEKLLPIEHLDEAIKDYEEAIIASSDILDKDTLIQELAKRHVSFGLCHYLMKEQKVYIGTSVFIELCFDEAGKLGLVPKIHWYMCDTPSDCDSFKEIVQTLENRLKIMKRVKELYYGECNGTAD